eukprot:COSAG06_NODE_14676_length_1136_cov_1.331726_1_plen_296_part_10
MLIIGTRIIQLYFARRHVRAAEECKSFSTPTGGDTSSNKEWVMKKLKDNYGLNVISEQAFAKLMGSFDKNSDGHMDRIEFERMIDTVMRIVSSKILLKHLERQIEDVPTCSRCTRNKQTVELETVKPQVQTALDTNYGLKVVDEAKFDMFLKVFDTDGNKSIDCSELQDMINGLRRRKKSADSLGLAMIVTGVEVTAYGLIHIGFWVACRWTERTLIPRFAQAIGAAGVICLAINSVCVYTIRSHAKRSGINLRQVLCPTRNRDKSNKDSTVVKDTPNEEATEKGTDVLMSAILVF